MADAERGRQDADMEISGDFFLTGEHFYLFGPSESLT